jgi:Glucitol operon activator protein (GutM).
MSPNSCAVLHAGQTEKKGDIMNYLLLILAAVTVQTMLVYRQYQVVQRQVGAVRKEYPVVSVGVAKGALNRSAVLAFDRDGVLQKAYMLAGLTVFARLREVTSYNGHHYGQVKRLCAGNKRMRCVVNAIAFAERHFQVSQEGETHD